MALQGRLRKNLGTVSQDALTYICIDLDRLPPGRVEKARLIEQLVEWVCALSSDNLQNTDHNTSEWKNLCTLWNVQLSILKPR